MSKQEFAKLQSCVLKVDIQCHCDGCKKKVKKLIQKVDGVYTSNIDADQGKVTVTGNVNPATLIKKLSKSGKHAELWVSQKGTNNFQINAQKTGKDNKSQKGHNQQKGGGGGQQVQQFQHMQQQKGPKEMMKQQKKSVKFDMNNEEFDESEDDFDGDLDEFDDDFDDDFDEDDDDDDDFHRQVPKGHQQFPNKMAPMGMMGNGNGLHGHQTMMNSQAKGGGGGGGGKKGGAIDIPVSMKGMGGKNDSKHGNNGNGGGKKGGGGDGGKKGKGGSNNQKQGGKDKNGGKGGIMEFFGFGKKNKKKGGGGGMDGTDKSSKGNGRVGGGGGNNNGGGAKPGRGKGSDGVQDMKKMKNEFELDVTKPGKGPKGGGGNHGGGNGIKTMGPMGGQMGPMGPMGGQMGPMGPMGGQMGQMGNYGHMGMTMTPAAVQGLPAGAAGSINGGYYHGMGGGGIGGPVNPYAQQQHMPMMMNQQHPNMGDMYQYQMMHGRPNPAMNYMPPPLMPPHPAVRDPYTHYFSDENTDGGCSIM